MPSTPTDVHYSDVHLSVPGSTPTAEATTSFAWCGDDDSSDIGCTPLKAAKHDGSSGASPSELARHDHDGDALLARRRGAASSGGLLKVRHALATPLPDVGLQVWRGALLLCDYLLAQPRLLRGATVLELGGGCGLSGLLAASPGLRAKRVYVTDCVDAVLDNAQANIELNGVGEVARVRRLDWAEPPPQCVAPTAAAAAGLYECREDDLAELRGCTLILAADCVYSNDMTAQLVACLNALLRSLPGAVALVAMELRVNFCVSSLAARAPAVDYFADGLEVAGLEHRRVPTRSFPQRFEYERVKELELWRVTVRTEGESDGSEEASTSRSAPHG